MKSNVKDFAIEIRKEKPDWSPEGTLLSVYKIPLNFLYYNDDNGRVATHINEHKHFYGENSLDNLNIEEFNDLIHSFIKKSNSKESFDKTLKDMSIKGQIRPGVVLSDGRIVSGNRRFTVLRELFKDTGSDKFGFFECFIIEKSIENELERKEIKTIERLTQFGVDEKVEYDPISRLVDIYNDLIGPRKIWDKTEYQKKLNLKKADVELMYNKAMIMSDYLTYLGKPGHFYIARAQKLDGPLQELVRVYGKIDKPEWNRIRVVFYSHLAEPGDTTRIIRDLIKVYNGSSKEFCNLLEKVVNDIENNEKALFEKEMDNNSTIDTAEEENIILSKETKTEVFAAAAKMKAEAIRESILKKVNVSIDNISFHIEDVLNSATEHEKALLKQRINSLKKKIDSIKILED